MATYGEETVEIPINKGIWVTTTPESTPEGYCSEFTNVLVNELGNVVPRGSFVTPPDTPTTYSNSMELLYTASDLPRLQYYANAGGAFTPLGGDSFNEPACLVGGEARMYNVTYNNYPTFDYTFGGGRSYFLGQGYAVLYRDRLYALELVSHNIYRLTGWDFVVGSGALTEVATTGFFPDMGGMIYHKSRLFCWEYGRIYFTDEAAAGGYPETWNSGTNFFDLPSDGKPVVYNMFSVGNIIYVFSADGIFTVVTYGTPSNWIVKKVESSVILSAGTDVCITLDNIMYFCDGESVYAYNGEKKVDIGSAIKEALATIDGYGVSYAVFPFEKGILLTVQQQHQVSTGGANYRHEIRTSRVFYFDGNIWSEITYGSNTILSVGESVVCATSQFGQGGVNTTSYVALSYGTAYNSVTHKIFYYDANSLAETFTCALTVPVRSNLIQEKFIKHGVIDLYTKITSFFKSDVAQGISTAEDTITITPLSNDFNYLARFKTPGFTRRLSLRFRIVHPGSGTGSTKLFKIKKIFLNLNTSRKEPDNVSG